MKAYYRTQISDKYGKTIPIVYEGEWYGEKFTGTDEKGFEIIVRKKEWIFFNREQENKELKESLNVAKYKDHKEDETDKERRDRINRFRSGY